MPGVERPRRNARKVTGFIYAKMVPEKTKRFIAGKKAAMAKRTEIRKLTAKMKGMERQILAWKKEAGEGRDDLARFKNRPLDSFKGYGERDPQEVKDHLCAGCEKKAAYAKGQAEKLQGELKGLWEQREQLRFALRGGKKKPAAAKK